MIDLFSFWVPLVILLSVTRNKKTINKRNESNPIKRGFFKHNTLKSDNNNSINSYPPKPKNK